MLTSPKRKRDSPYSAGVAFDPTTQPSLLDPAVPDSPRRKVTRQFQDLRLGKDELSSLGRENDGQHHDSRQVSADVKGVLGHLKADTPLGQGTEGVVVEQSRIESSRADAERTGLDDVLTTSTCSITEEARPSAKGTVPAKAHKKMPSPRRKQKLRTRRKPPSETEQVDNLQLLTWQDHEITGHEVTDPDDDGEGMNGIGFIPTPAIVHARTEKRKQQIQMYKNREANEARRLRSERRRAGEAKRSGADESEIRRVRFAESKD